MKKFIISTLALAGIGTVGEAKTMDIEGLADLNSVVEKKSWIRSILDEKLPFTFAGHRSHSSHGSHGSHGSHRSSGVSPVPKSSPSTRNPGSTPPTSVLPTKPVTGQSKEFTKKAMQVQLNLFIFNFYYGPIDGRIGPKSKEAILRYQIQNSLTATGKIDDELLKHMGIR